MVSIPITCDRKRSPPNPRVPRPSTATWDEVPGEDGQHPKDRRLDASEARESLEQLVALGYIERPPENEEKAVAQTVRELNYNLARAYMDAGLHGEAVPLLAELYSDYPLEFRFGTGRRGLEVPLCRRALFFRDSTAPTRPAG